MELAKVFGSQFGLVIGIEGLPFHFEWVSAWLGKGQPWNRALMVPLENGDLYKLAIVIWALSLIRILGCGVCSAQSIGSRQHYTILICAAGVTAIPLVSFMTVFFMTTDNGLPLQALGLRIEELSAASIFIISMWSRLFGISCSGGGGVVLSRNLFRSPR